MSVVVVVVVTEGSQRAGDVALWSSRLLEYGFALPCSDGVRWWLG
jgi:hypothetical protein